MTEFTNMKGESQRLILRPTSIEDFSSILAGLKNQKPAQHQYDDDEIGLDEIYTEAFCEKSAQNFCQYAKDDKVFLFRVYRKEDGYYLGGVIIKTILRKHYQWAEIGYWLLNQHWGHGYGAEMLKVGIDIAFNDLDFHRVEAQINLDNHASQKTAENAGMTFECIRKGFLFEAEQWTDHMIYVMNASK